MYLSYNRLHDSSRAADALIELKANLEARRAGIADPLERGGVFGDYKYLFDALCEKLQESGRIPDLLEAIEAAKGRGIADILTQKAGKPVADADIDAAVRTIPELAVENGFHYLTFHVDEERTYAVLVTKHGDLHSPDPVPLGREMIRETATHADPRDWGQPSDVNPAVRLANASEALAPLVAWLEPLVSDGRIEAGDHLCYVADEDLANVPLHYVRFGDGTLADLVSVSKIHGAFHLDLLLNAPDADRPSTFFGIVVPTKQNASQSNWAARKKAMWQPIEWLRARLKGDDVADTAADLADAPGWPLQHRVLHLSTHGVFPSDATPFEHCGVVLANDGKLPDETVVAAGADLGAVLTPSKVLDLQLNLEGSHVSLMSCVSGLSHEGRGGDALGLEWALIQAGAKSVLASHWFVSARLAAEFFEHFYQHWIDEGKSRADAHADAMREMKAAHGDDQMDAWAAFSLVGDWR
jgi:CHAT domain-containing protein